MNQQRIIVAPTIVVPHDLQRVLGIWNWHQQGDRRRVPRRSARLNAQNAAGYQDTLPQNFILAGHSIGGGIAAAAANHAVDNGAADDGLLGVVMFDSVGHMLHGLHVFATPSSGADQPRHPRHPGVSDRVPPADLEQPRHRPTS